MRKKVEVCLNYKRNRGLLGQRQHYIMAELYFIAFPKFVRGIDGRRIGKPERELIFSETIKDNQGTLQILLFRDSGNSDINEKFISNHILKVLRDNI